MKDIIGDRIKKNYEDTTRIYLPRRSYTISRIDGKSFHSYCKGLTKPFDEGLINDMDETAIHLCKNIQGVQFAFVQSDEISLLITDFEDIKTQAWFDNNLQKMCSISASLTASKFNQLRFKRYNNVETKLADFDSTIFQIPQKQEVMNYFIWRQKDCTRNSISTVAQSLYSHKELTNKNTNEMQEMIFQKGINWNDYDEKYKRGRIIVKQQFEVNGAIRNKWVSIAPPIFTQDKDFLNELIPTNN